MREIDACRRSVLLALTINIGRLVGGDLTRATGTLHAVIVGVKTDQTLSDRLRAWQARERLSQPAAAVALNVPFATYRNWISGRRVPSTGMLAAIERVIGAK